MWESLLNSSRLRPIKPLWKRGRVACMVGEAGVCVCRLDATEMEMDLVAATEGAIFQGAWAPSVLWFWACSPDRWHSLVGWRAGSAQSMQCALADGEAFVDGFYRTSSAISYSTPGRARVCPHQGFLKCGPRSRNHVLLLQIQRGRPSPQTLNILIKNK
jgi:hypothetical protein